MQPHRGFYEDRQFHPSQTQQKNLAERFRQGRVPGSWVEARYEGWEGPRFKAHLFQIRSRFLSPDLPI